MINPKIAQESQKLTTSGVVDLYILDLTVIGVSQLFYFHNMYITGQQSVWWKGIEYLPMPIEATGFEMSGNKQTPRPTLRVSNVTGLFSAMLQDMDDLVGARITRQRTFAKFLDPDNYGGINPDADEAATFSDEVWFIDRKSLESKAVVEFELCVPWDLTGVTLPALPCSASHCVWEYRGDGCNYTGGPVADINNDPTGSLATDRCSKTLVGCQLRYGQQGVLKIGVFPAVGIIR
jgi:lambda family phage minor tail protein L